MLASVIVLLLGLASVAAEKIEHHSFEPPFNEIDNSGQRMVGKFWRTSGHAVVNSNFARLTPDRQSKKGALWSRKALGVPSFFCVFKFRISGQGKNFFGDGVALWITQQSFYNPGDLHGSQENFVGIGVIFDTFRNTENIHAHRDVTLLINDGEKTWDMMTEDIHGCNANFRYHAERADFSVTDASRAKVLISNDIITVVIDPRNSGEWTDCVQVQNPGLPKDWLKTAYVGVTASTGQLADNHDVISLLSFSDFDVMESDEEERAEKRNFAFGDHLDYDKRIERIEDQLNDMVGQYQKLDHHVEHALASVQDHIANMISKLEKREDKSEGRIEDLESVIKKEVDGTLQERLNRLELQLNGNMNRKVKGMENQLGNKIKTLESTAGQDTGSWKIPFLIIVALLVAAAVGMFIFYKQLLKKHIL